METETIDRLYLELSQVTTAKTKREIELEQEIERLRDILRIDNGRLEIRMSYCDIHIKQFIPEIALDRAGSPRELVAGHAALMYSKLDAEMAKKYGA